jgi:hypothetical protein
MHLRVLRLKLTKIYVVEVERCAVIVEMLRP